MNKPRRSPVSAATRHQLNEQCDSACAACRETRTSRLTIHHIDGHRQDSRLANLLLICANCHAEFTSGTKSEADARMFKRMAETGNLHPRKGVSSAQGVLSTVINSGTNNGVMGNTVNVEKVQVPRDRRGTSPRDLPGTIGADADMRTYADYLVKKYIFCRKQGEKRVTQKGGKFEAGSAHSILGEGYGVTNSVFQISQVRFFDWVQSAQAKIRRTVFAKSLRHELFHTWEEHLRERHPVDVRTEVIVSPINRVRS